jgi:NAD(P)-dependent dehydrogenase (short-subunit alcohol dehydrogenase family)
MGTSNEEHFKTPTMRLDGLVAVVSGAGRGLGRACALALAEAGASLVLVSRTESELQAVAAIIAAEGGTASTIVCDVTDVRQVDRVIGGLERIDVLVNAAGFNIPEPLDDVTEEHFDKVMTVNVKGTFMVSQAAVRRMRAGSRGGAIINISSQMGHVGAPNRTVYCASKHAVEGMTKAMAVELAPEKIRVNSIGPTFILTPLTEPFFEDKAFREDTLRRIPRGEVGQPTDVMGAVVFLASPAAALITGAGLVIDGGWTAW